MESHTGSKTEWLEQELASLKEQGLFNTIRVIDSPMDAHIVIDGQRVLNFCANNYLGLANHARLREAAKHGFKRAIVPKANAPKQADLELLPVSRLADALGEI